MGLGYVEGVTHDYVRNGTTTLFAALDIASGMVLTECKPRQHRAATQNCLPESLRCTKAYKVGRVMGTLDQTYTSAIRHLVHVLK